MKKILFLIVMLCGTALSTYADDKGNAVVRSLAAAVKELGNYDVSFSVTGGESNIEGNYTVVGRGYTMRVGDVVEVYCDGKLRYEINNEYKEITIDNVNTSEHNILNNPVDGLDFVSDEYHPQLLSDNSRESVVRLTAANGSANDNMVVDVTVDSKSHLPRRIEYVIANDRVVITINDIRRTTTPLARFDASRYKDYDIIDFR